MRKTPHFSAIVSCYAAQFNLGAANAHYRHGDFRQMREAMQRAIRYLYIALSADPRTAK